jgi:hypothetical protein
VAVVALLLVVAPTASASASPSPKTLRSPYAGYGYGYESGYFDGCGGSALFAKTPYFNATNGHGYALVQSNSSSCGKIASDSEAYSEAEFEISSLTLPSGHGSIRERWSATFSFNLVAHPGKRGSADAYVAIFLYSYLYDATNHTYAASSYTNPFYNSTTSGTLAASYSGVSMVDYVNGTFASGHTYYLYLQFELEAYSEASSKIASAGAVINCGTSGNSAKLTSITVP